jgi:uncharacterized protein YbcI
MTRDDQSIHVNGPASDAARERVSSQLVEISRAMVRIYKEQFGRGPNRVRSHYAGPDTIVSLLEETLTPVERTLTTLGHDQRLRDLRMLFQYAAEDEFRSAVEQITGRTVIAFVSGIDVQTDTASELFVLEPRSLHGNSQQQ